jgi:hypothetical protein
VVGEKLLAREQRAGVWDGRGGRGHGEVSLDAIGLAIMS